MAGIEEFDKKSRNTTKLELYNSCLSYYLIANFKLPRRQ